jgi:hypothetical protein
MKIFIPKVRKDRARSAFLPNGQYALTIYIDGFVKIIAYDRSHGPYEKGKMPESWDWVHKDYRLFDKRKKKRTESIS